MDMDKLETALEDKFAAKDAALAEPSAEPESSAPVSIEDFTSCSR